MKLTLEQVLELLADSCYTDWYIENIWKGEKWGKTIKEKDVVKCRQIPFYDLHYFLAKLLDSDEKRLRFQIDVLQDVLELFECDSKVLEIISDIRKLNSKTSLKEFSILQHRLMILQDATDDYRVAVATIIIVSVLLDCQKLYTGKEKHNNYHLSAFDSSFIFYLAGIPKKSKKLAGIVYKNYKKYK